MKNGNGSRRARKEISKARLKILLEAQRKGFVTNAKAKKIGGFKQVWFHLNKMVEAGVLERDGFNNWIPAKRRGRPPKHLEL
jgi:hypothetical protein